MPKKVGRSIDASAPASAAAVEVVAGDDSIEWRASIFRLMSEERESGGDGKLIDGLQRVFITDAVAYTLITGKRCIAGSRD